MRAIQMAMIASALVVVSGCEAGPIADAKEQISRNMREPDATRFRDVSICPHDKSVISGEVNAKDSFGAYSGFKDFYYASERWATSEETDKFRALMTRCHPPEGMQQTDDLWEEPESTYGEEPETSPQ